MYCSTSVKHAPRAVYFLFCLCVSLLLRKYCRIIFIFLSTLGQLRLGACVRNNSEVLGKY